jgi:hypothetical protein
MKINIIQGKNCSGKTQKICEMLGYEHTEYCKSHIDKKQYYGTDHISKRILGMNIDGLIVRIFLENKCKKCTEIINTYKKMIEQGNRKKERERDISTGGDKRGYKNLCNGFEFNSWKLYNLLEKHSRDHKIDIWITVLQKNNLIPLFQKLNNMKIHRLFIEGLNITWLIAEIKEKFDHMFWIPEPVQYKFQFPQLIDEIYIESKSNHEEVIFTPIDIEPISAPKTYYTELWKKLGVS